jgi:demethylmenaquinone methyltransferase/2-methoxy-6-polyprenyl-1,4-benzoquinol methylase
LQEIIPSYELASSRISIHEDRVMRAKVIAFAVRRDSLVLDLGAGPGVLSKLVASNGGEPVLLDVSQVMLETSHFPNRIRGVFEFLPFREGIFDSVVSGFALRDSHDLQRAVWELARVLSPGGRLSFCDLGKPDSVLAAVMVAVYLKVAPAVIGLVTAGLTGLRYGSLYDTYVLTLHNSELKALLSRHFGSVKMDETQLGGSIVVKCVKSG